MTISHIVTGVINWDKTIFVKKFPKEGEEVKVERIIDIPGGKGANVAVASSRILGKDKVALFGALGSDFIADKQVEVLRNEGILTNLIQFTSVPSGQAYIIVDSEGRNTCDDVQTGKRYPERWNTRVKKYVNVYRGSTTRDCC
jgi:ribokinase